MFTKEVLRYFKLHLNLCNLIGSISHEWDSKKQKLSVLQSPTRIFQFKCHISIAVIHNLFLVFSFLLQNINAYGIAYKMLAIYFTVGYTLCNGLRIICWIFQDEMAALVNSQLNFEKAWRERTNNPAQNKSGGESMEKVLLILGLITGISVPLLVFLILLAHPCLPPFVGSLLFTYQNNSCNIISRTLYLSISIFNFWTHLDMVLPMVFTMFGLFFMSIGCLQDYLDIVKRDFIIGKSGVLMTPLIMYRRIQILEKQVNICFRRYYFPLFLSGMTALLIFCLHSCIKLPGKIPMPGFSYFPIVVVDGIVSLLVMNTKAADVSEHSVEIIQCLKCNLKVKRKHWAMKMTYSLKPLKIYFGMNFVDKITPLVMINFSVNQVVSLLLIQSE